MNILYLINYAGAGGTEKYIKIFASELKRNNSIYFIYNHYGDLCDELKNLDIPVQQIKMKSPFDVLASLKIAYYCKKNKIDLIHTQFQREAYLCVIAKIFYSKFKLIYTCHINIKNGFIRKFMNRVICKKYDAITTVSTEGKDILINNKLPKEKMSIIFNGIDYKENQQGLRDSIIRKELNIDEKTFIYTTLTRFSKEKGNEFLIRSVEFLKKNVDKPFKVLFVGEGDLINSCKEQAKNLNDVIIFLGYRKDTAKILEESNVILNSSENEALSFAILEGMAKGLPVIATNVGGNKDIVNKDTNCGLLVNYGDIESYAKAMKEILYNEDIYKVYSENSLKIIKSKFNLKETIKQTYSLYERLVSNVN